MKVGEAIRLGAASVAVATLAACGEGGPSPEEIARQRAAFDAASPVVLDVGGQAQALPVRDLGGNLPNDYPDQFCIPKPVLNCGLHNFVYNDGEATALDINGRLSNDSNPDCKIIYTRKEGTLDSGDPLPVRALVASVPGRPTPELTARVLVDGSIEVCDAAAQRTPDKTDGFIPNPVVIFVIDPVTQTASLRSPDRSTVTGRTPATVAARRNSRGAARGARV